MDGLHRKKQYMEEQNLLQKEYIQYGQSTLYLQKFDVVDDYETELYYHQYMQNVSAAKTEGEEVRGAYKKLGFINTSNEIPFNFLIPVYENMPKQELPISRKSNNCNTKCRT